MFLIIQERGSYSDYSREELFLCKKEDHAKRYVNVLTEAAKPFLKKPDVNYLEQNRLKLELLERLEAEIKELILTFPNIKYDFYDAPTFSYIKLQIMDYKNFK